MAICISRGCVPKKLFMHGSVNLSVSSRSVRHPGTCKSPHLFAFVNSIKAHLPVNSMSVRDMGRSCHVSKLVYVLQWPVQQYLVP